MRRLVLSLAGAVLTAGFIAPPSAFAQQSVNFFVGGFVPVAMDARGDISGGRSNDQLVVNKDYLLFNMDHFDGTTFGGEYLVGIGRFFEAGGGVGFFQETVPAADANYFNSNGTNIVADLKLRIVPFNATFKVLPLGSRAPVVPYVGAGVGIYWWRYSESGQFVDYTPPVPRNPVIFNGTFLGSGTAVGPMFMGGVRVPIGPMAPGFEVRYQAGMGDLPKDQSFSASKIDLGGMSYLFTFQIRF